LTTWLTIAVLAAGTAAIKAAGPVALSRREPPQRLVQVIALLAPSLLAALVVYESVHTGNREVVVDARLAGLAAAAVALALRLPLLVVVAVAVGATAAIRAVT
jgi:uncharacterized membrane protein